MKTTSEMVAKFDTWSKSKEVYVAKSPLLGTDLVPTWEYVVPLMGIIEGAKVLVPSAPRIISRKNRLLAQQIAEHVTYKKKYWTEIRAQVPVATPDEDSLTDEQLFQYIHDVIVRENLFLDPSFGRQTIIDRFQLSKERVGAIFSKSSEHSKLSGYVQQLRLEYAAKLLIEQPEKSIVQIASDCGFSSHTYFSARFRQHFGMSPSDFRRDVLEL